MMPTITIVFYTGFFFIHYFNDVKRVTVLIFGTIDFVYMMCAKFFELTETLIVQFTSDRTNPQITGLVQIQISV